MIFKSNEVMSIKFCCDRKGTDFRRTATYDRTNAHKYEYEQKQFSYLRPCSFTTASVA